MTLIIATLMKDGAVLASDRRAISISRSTGEERVMTDEAEKIFVADNIAVAIAGESKSLANSAAQTVSIWLQFTYKPAIDFEQQIKALYQDYFKSGDIGMFIAVQNNAKGTILISSSDGLKIVRVTDSDRMKIKFFGWGNTIASRIVHEIEPKFDFFDSEAILDFSNHVILRAHFELEGEASEINSVGYKVMAAVITHADTKLLYKASDHGSFKDYYNFPNSKLLNKDFLKLKNAKKSEKPKYFADYCQKAITAKESGAMNLRDAAYCIAGTMFLFKQNEPMIHKITDLAGELELPAHIVSGDPEQKWLELVALVQSYESKI